MGPPLHGLLAVAGLVVLLAPFAPLGWRRAGLGLILVVLGFGSGWALYPGYREQVKPGLLRHAPALARAFELKEHLALFTLALTVAGVGVLLAAGDDADSGGLRLARVLLLGGGLCGLAVAVIGGVVVLSV